MSSAERAVRRVFVIMPFVSGGSRNQAQLTAFFETNLKRSIESSDLHDRYEVYRSGQSFDINAEIIRDLCRADIVIADLSGTEPNPNVMYELGVRLATSARPVILIREQQPDNRKIFDIYGFYTHLYDPYDYRQLERHLLDKLRRWESGEEPYLNPVLTIVQSEAAKLNPSLTDVAPKQQRELALRGVQAVAHAIARAYGPNGIGLGLEVRGGGVRLEKRGVDIARGIRSANLFEQAGIRLMADAAAEMRERAGDGSKLPVIVAHSLIEESLKAIDTGAARQEVLGGITKAIARAIEHLRENSQDGFTYGRAVAQTASHGPLDVDIFAAITSAGPNGIVRIVDADSPQSSVQSVDHMVFERGALHRELIAGCPNRKCVLENCDILLFTDKISSMRDLIPVMEVVAKRNRPLLVIAADVEGEALATLVVNHKRGTLRCVAVGAPGHGRGRFEHMQDLAVLTGATVLDPEGGGRLDKAGPHHLGAADKVIVGAEQTEIIGGRGDRRLLDEHVEALREAARTASRDDGALLTERVARLAGVVVTISLGATTSQQRRDKRYRALSALNAAGSALSGGCVIGAGRALHHASQGLEELCKGSEGLRAGVAAAAAALQAPLRAIVATSGRGADAIVTDLNQADPVLGFNVETQRVEDLALAGVLDPASTVAEALLVAESTARTFLETGAWHLEVQAVRESAAPDF